MNVHDASFWACASFLLGVFLVSISYQLAIFIFLIGCVAACLLSKKREYIFYFSLIAILGAVYFYGSDFVNLHARVPFGEDAEFRGIIVHVGKSAARQEMIVKLQTPYTGRVKIIAQRYPDFSYGDLVGMSGVIKEPPTEFLSYYQKERIAGIINYPKIELKDRGRGNFIKAMLLDVKSRVITTFRRTLPAQKAAFLSGIVLGEREEFSKEFKEKMSLSGTTHLVALSGYNISVVAIAAATLFGAWFSRRISFYLSVGVIVLFVLMTGGEASIVRAAIMGIISLVAKETERMYSVRNAIVIAAFLMVLWNPRVLVFDLGFQLSFAALLGIVYLVPQLKSIFRVAENGVLNWKENAVTTIGAQLAVAPLLLGTFGIFSLTSFLANILILSAVPLTMGLGFLMGGLGFVSEFLARIVGLAADLLLTYELWIIDVFSRISLPIAVESFGFFAAVIYYAILAGCVYKFGKK
jgi:competence protein ComEC